MPSLYVIDSKIMGQFDIPFDLKFSQYVFSYEEFNGKSENQLENGKFSSENAFCSILLTLV